jgi:hypothetical protein
MKTTKLPYSATPEELKNFDSVGFMREQRDRLDAMFAKMTKQEMISYLNRSRIIKNQNNMKTIVKTTVIAFLMAMFTLPIMAQLSTLPEKKINWSIDRIEHMTKEDMQARITAGIVTPNANSDGNGRVMRFKVRMQIPAGVFDGDEFQLRTGQLNFIIRDRFGNPMSELDNIARAANGQDPIPIIARHLFFATNAPGSNSAIPAFGNGSSGTSFQRENRFSFSPGGQNSTREASFGGTIARATGLVDREGNEIIFEFPVYLEQVGSFQLCFYYEAARDGCGLSAAGLGNLSNCPTPQPFALMENNITASILNGAIPGTYMDNFMTGPSNQILQGGTSYAPQFMNNFVCGGIFFPLGLELGFESPVCPWTDMVLKPSGTLNAPGDALKIEFEHATNGWTTLWDFKAGSGSAGVSGPTISTAGLVDSIAHQITIAGIHMAPNGIYHNVRVRTILGTDTTLLEKKIEVRQGFNRRQLGVFLNSGANFTTLGTREPGTPDNFKTTYVLDVNRATRMTGLTNLPPNTSSAHFVFNSPTDSVDFKRAMVSSPDIWSDVLRTSGTSNQINPTVPPVSTMYLGYHKQIISGATCWIPTDTVVIAPPMTVTVTVPLKVCPKADYDTLMVSFNNPSGVPVDFSTIEFRLDGETYDLPFVPVHVDINFSAAFLADPIAFGIEWSDLESLLGEDLRAVLKDDKGMERFSAIFRIELANVPKENSLGLFSGANRVLNLPAHNGAPSLVCGNTLELAFDNSPGLSGTGITTGVATNRRNITQFFTTYNVEHRYVTTHFNQNTPGFAIPIRGDEEYRIVGFTTEGRCYIESNWLKVQANDDCPKADVTNVYGNMACWDTLSLVAEIPTGSAGFFHWYMVGVPREIGGPMNTHYSPDPFVVYQLNGTQGTNEKADFKLPKWVKDEYSITDGGGGLTMGQCMVAVQSAHQTILGMVEGFGEGTLADWFDMLSMTYPMPEPTKHGDYCAWWEEVLGTLYEDEGGDGEMLADEIVFHWDADGATGSADICGKERACNGLPDVVTGPTWLKTPAQFASRFPGLSVVPDMVSPTKATLKVYITDKTNATAQASFKMFVEQYLSSQYFFMTVNANTETSYDTWFNRGDGEWTASGIEVPFLAGNLPPYSAYLPGGNNQSGHLGTAGALPTPNVFANDENGVLQNEGATYITSPDNLSTVIISSNNTSGGASLGNITAYNGTLIPTGLDVLSAVWQRSATGTNWANVTPTSSANAFPFANGNPAGNDNRWRVMYSYANTPQCMPQNSSVARVTTSFDEELGTLSVTGVNSQMSTCGNNIVISNNLFDNIVMNRLQYRIGGVGEFVTHSSIDWDPNQNPRTLNLGGTPFNMSFGQTIEIRMQGRGASGSESIHISNTLTINYTEAVNIGTFSPALRDVCAGTAETLTLSNPKIATADYTWSTTGTGTPNLSGVTGNTVNYTPTPAGNSNMAQHVITVNALNSTTGCSGTASVTVRAFDRPVIANQTITRCAGIAPNLSVAPSGTWDVTWTGTGGPYSGTSPTLSDNTYSVTAQRTSAPLCPSTTATVIVASHAALTPSITVPSRTCNSDASTVLTLAGGIPSGGSVVWSGPGITAGTETGATLTLTNGWSNGTYIVTVTDVNGCISTDSKTLTSVCIDEGITVSLNMSTPICDAQTTTINFNVNSALPITEIRITNATGTIIPLADVTIGGTAPARTLSIPKNKFIVGTSYVIWVTNGTNNNVSGSFAIVENPVLSSFTTNSPQCAGNNITISTGATGTLALWSVATSGITTGGTSFTSPVTTLSTAPTATHYFYGVLTNAGCASAPLAGSYIVNELPVITSFTRTNAPTRVNCNLYTAELTLNATYPLNSTIVWKFNGTDIVPPAAFSGYTNYTVSPDGKVLTLNPGWPAGAYTATITTPAPASCPLTTPAAINLSSPGTGATGCPTPTITKQTESGLTACRNSFIAAATITVRSSHEVRTTDVTAPCGPITGLTIGLPQATGNPELFDYLVTIPQAFLNGLTANCVISITNAGSPAPTAVTATITVHSVTGTGSVASPTLPLCPGETTTLSYSAPTSTEIGTINRVWQISTDGGGTWNPVTPAASGETFTTPNTLAANSTTHYRVVATFGACTSPVNSTAAIVTINPTPITPTVSVDKASYCQGETITITTNLPGTGATVTFGSTFGFSATKSSTGNPTFNTTTSTNAHGNHNVNAQFFITTAGKECPSGTVISSPNFEIKTQPTVTISSPINVCNLDPYTITVGSKTAGSSVIWFGPNNTTTEITTGINANGDLTVGAFTPATTIAYNAKAVLAGCTTATFTPVTLNHSVGQCASGTVTVTNVGNNWACNDALFEYADFTIVATEGRSITKVVVLGATPVEVTTVPGLWISGSAASGAGTIRIPASSFTEGARSYTIQVTNNALSPVTGSSTFVVRPKPVVTAASGTPVCEDLRTQFSAVSTPADATTTYRWFNGSMEYATGTTPQNGLAATPTTPGVKPFTVVATLNECSSEPFTTGTWTVTENAKPITMTISPSIVCPTTPATTITITTERDIDGYARVWTNVTGTDPTRVNGTTWTFPAPATTPAAGIEIGLNIKNSGCSASGVNATTTSGAGNTRMLIVKERPTTGGTISYGGSAICANNAPTVAMSLTTPQNPANNTQPQTYQWQFTTTPAVEASWANVTTGTGGTSSSYTPGVLTTTTSYRLLVKFDCGDPIPTNPVSITVNPAPTTPTITGMPNPAEVCFGSSITGLTLSDAGSSRTWELSGGGLVSPIPLTHANPMTIPTSGLPGSINLVGGNDYTITAVVYSGSGLTGCASLPGTATFRVNPRPDAPVISGFLKTPACVGTNNITVQWTTGPAGGNTYQLYTTQSGVTINPNVATFTAPAGTGNVTATQTNSHTCTSLASTETRTYTVHEESGTPTFAFSATSGCVDVLAPTLSDVDVSLNATSFSLSDGTTTWNDGGTGNQAARRAALIANYNAARPTLTGAGPLTFTLTVNYEACGPLTAIRDITITPRPTVTLSSSHDDFCAGTQNPTITANPSAGTVGSWGVSSDGGITWMPTPPLSGTGNTRTFTTTGLADGTYRIRALATDGACAGTVYGHVDVVVRGLPTLSFTTIPVQPCMYDAFSFVAATDASTIAWYTGSSVIPANLIDGLNTSYTGATTTTLTRIAPTGGSNWGATLQVTARVTGANGCQRDLSVTATSGGTCNSPIPILDAPNTRTLSCWSDTVDGVTVELTGAVVATHFTIGSHTNVTDFTKSGQIYTLPGKYFVIGANNITAHNGALNSTARTITVPARPDAHTVSTISTAICETQSALTLNVTGGTSPYTIVPTVGNPTTFTTSGVDGITVSNIASLTPGIYNFTAHYFTNGGTCKSTEKPGSFVVRPVVSHQSTFATLALVDIAPVCQGTNTVIAFENYGSYSFPANTLFRFTPTVFGTNVAPAATYTSSSNLAFGSTNVSAEMWIDGCKIKDIAQKPAVVHPTNFAATIDGTNHQICAGGSMDLLTVAASASQNGTVTYELQISEYDAGSWSGFTTVASGTIAQVNTYLSTGSNRTLTKSTRFQVRTVSTIATGACAVATSNIREILVNAQPAAITISTLATSPGTEADYGAHNMTVSGLTNQTHVSWYYCSGNVPGCNQTNNPIATATSGLNSFSMATIVNAFGGVTGDFTIVANSVFNPSSPALGGLHGCIPQLSNPVVINVVPGTLNYNGVLTSNSPICITPGSITATLAPATVINTGTTDQITWQYSTAASPGAGDWTLVQAQAPFDPSVGATVTFTAPQAGNVHVRAFLELTGNTTASVSRSTIVVVDALSVPGNLSPSADLFVCSGANFGTAITASGTNTASTVTWTWKRDGSTIAGQTTGTLAANAVTSVVAPTVVLVEVKNGECPVVPSASVTITPHAVPTINTFVANPTAQCFGTPSVLTVTTDLDGVVGNTLTYSWFRGTTSGSLTSFGSNAASQNVNPPGTADVREFFRVEVVNNGCAGTNMKPSSEIHVDWSFPITTKAVTLNFTSPSCEESVVATYAGGGAVQSWKLLKDGTDVSHADLVGVTASSTPAIPLTLGAEASAVFTFVANVKNGACPAEDVTAAITITKSPVARDITPTNLVICRNATLNSPQPFTVASGSVPAIPDAYEMFIGSDPGDAGQLANPSNWDAPASWTVAASTAPMPILREPAGRLDTTYLVRAVFGNKTITTGGCQVRFSDPVSITVLAEPILTPTTTTELNKCVTDASISTNFTPTAIRGDWAWEIEDPTGAVTTGLSGRGLSTFQQQTVSSPVEGIYTFTLTVTNTGETKGAYATCSEKTITQTIKVWEVVQAGNILTPDTTICVGGSVPLRAANPVGTPITISWKHGTTEFSTASATQAIVTSANLGAVAGTNTITLTVGNDGCGDHTSDPITVTVTNSVTGITFAYRKTPEGANETNPVLCAGDPLYVRLSPANFGDVADSIRLSSVHSTWVWDTTIAVVDISNRLIEIPNLPLIKDLEFDLTAFVIGMGPGTCGYYEYDANNGKITVWDTIIAGTIATTDNTTDVAPGASISINVTDQNWSTSNQIQTITWAPAAYFANQSLENPKTATANADGTIRLTITNGCRTSVSNDIPVTVQGSLALPTFIVENSLGIAVTEVCVNEQLILQISNIAESATSVTIKSGSGAGQWLNMTVDLATAPGYVNTVGELEVTLDALIPSASPLTSHNIVVNAVMAASPTDVVSGDAEFSITVRDTIKPGALTFMATTNALHSVAKGSPHGGLKLTGVAGYPTMDLMTSELYTVSQTGVRTPSNEGEWMADDYSRNIASPYDRWLVSGPATNWNTYSNRMILGNGFDTVYFRVIADNGVCPAVISNTIKLVLTPPTGLIITAQPTTVCEGNDVTVLATVPPGWPLSVDAGSQEWIREEFELGTTVEKTTVPNNITNLVAQDGEMTFVDIADVPGIYRYIIRYTTGGTPQADTSNLVTVDLATVGGEVRANGSTNAIELCEGAQTPELGLYLHVGSVIRWEFSDNSTDGEDGTWTTIAHTATTLPNSMVTDSGWYRAVVQNGIHCEEEFSAAILVRIFPIPDAGTINDPGVLPFGGHVTLVHNGDFTGLDLTWRNSPNNSTWTVITAADIDPIADLFGTRYYRVTVTNPIGGCSASESIKVMSYDTLEFKPGSNFNTNISAGNNAVFTAVVGGHEAGNNNFVTLIHCTTPGVPANCNGTITYEWFYTCDITEPKTWIPITGTEPEFTLNTDNTLEVANEWFWDEDALEPTDKENCTFKVVATWTEDGGTSHTESVTNEFGPIVYSAALVAGTIDKSDTLCYNGGGLLTLRNASPGTDITVTWECSDNGINFGTACAMLTPNPVDRTATISNFIGSKYFRARVEDTEGGLEYSDTVRVQSYDSLRFITNLNPTSQVVADGDDAVWTVVAGGANVSGTVNLSYGMIVYQWQIHRGGSDFEDITGADAPNIAISGPNGETLTVLSAHYLANPTHQYRALATWTANNGVTPCVAYQISAVGTITEGGRMNIAHIPGKGSNECIPVDTIVKLYPTEIDLTPGGISGPAGHTTAWFWSGKGAGLPAVPGTSYGDSLRLSDVGSAAYPWLVGIVGDTLIIKGNMNIDNTTFRLAAIHESNHVIDAYHDYNVCVFKIPNEDVIVIEDLTICSGQDAVFTISGLDGITMSNFQISWEKNGNPTTGNAVTLTDPNQTAGATYQAYLTTTRDLHPGINNDQPIVVSTNVATLTVVENFAITSVVFDPLDTVCAGENATITVTVTGGAHGSTYAWTGNGTDITDFVFETAPLTADATFKFEAFNQWCADIEETITIFVRGIKDSAFARQVDGLNTALKAPIRFIDGTNNVVSYTATVTPISTEVTNVFTYTWTATKYGIVLGAGKTETNVTSLVSTFGFIIDDMSKDSAEIKLVITSDCGISRTFIDSIFLIEPTLILDSLIVVTNGGTQILRNENDFAGTIKVCGGDIVYFTPRITGGTENFTIRWNDGREVYDDNNPITGTFISGLSRNDLETIKLGFRIRNANDTVINLTIEGSVTGEVAEAKVVVGISESQAITMSISPKMFGDAYFENQIMNIAITPNRPDWSYEFAIYIGDEFGDFGQKIDSAPRRIGNPTFNTAIPAGTLVKNSAAKRMTVAGTSEAMARVIGTATNSDLCVVSDTLEIKLIPIPTLLIPDDPFNPLNTVLFPNFDIEVFDTWGIRVQQFGTMGWNGKYNGRDVRSGTYYYNVRFPMKDGGFTVVSGAITVIRDSERIR